MARGDEGVQQAMWKLPLMLASGFDAVASVGGVLHTGIRTATALCTGASGQGGLFPFGAPDSGHPDRDTGPARPVSFLEAHPEGLAPITVAYERHGTGKPVVLLHGIGQDRHAWDQVIPMLTARREVIALDLPGFGQSPNLPADVPHDLPAMVAALGAAFTALGLRRPHVVGHSLGGLIALRLAQAGLARSVTALAPAGFWSEFERRYAFTVLITARHLARLPDVVVQRIAGTPVGRAALTGILYGRADCCPPDTLLTCLRALRQSTAFQSTLRAGRARDLFIGTISGMPVTIAWGTCDRLLPGRQAERATAMIPEARLVQLSGCGHVPMTDAPGQVARLILHTTASRHVSNRICGRSAGSEQADGRSSTWLRKGAIPAPNSTRA
ncbi:alpha/beta fold hydrolase [Nonomuraea turcica]|uniref:alpha/beta fold hydrolase n=1 Tax=Nonomuraea sp. G32 TaxID=3067274 RepID=UPI003530315B